MEVKTKLVSEKKFIGMKITTSISKDATHELWQNFMPRKKEITNTLDSNLYSITVYTTNYFEQFNPDAEFEKWAAVEVREFNEVPSGMQSFVSPEGLYAVFIFKGSSATGAGFFQYIFNEWFPASDYSVDQRPHFAVMGEKYKNNDPNSEEEIWIPAKPKVRV